jgi:phospho-N-acetylmuramoyl-pentapeptide-transferase
MGDTGSMSMGITIGVIAMLTNTTLLLPLFVPIFVIESGSVIIQLFSKKFRGKKVFLSTPIHHHFEALGWHETKVTMRFWIVSMISVILGIVIFFLNRFL